MAKKTLLPPPTLGKPTKPSKYSSKEEDDMDDEEEGCGCEGGHKGVMLKISILLPDTLQPKRGK